MESILQEWRRSSNEAVELGPLDLQVAQPSSGIRDEGPCAHRIPVIVHDAGESAVNHQAAIALLGVSCNQVVGGADDQRGQVIGRINGGNSVSLVDGLKSRGDHVRNKARGVRGARQANVFLARNVSRHPRRRMNEHFG